jgi:hypothetical protein
LEEKAGQLLPAGQVNPDQGELYWFADQPAVSLLKGR